MKITKIMVLVLFTVSLSVTHIFAQPGDGGTKNSKEPKQFQGFEPSIIALGYFSGIDYKGNVANYWDESTSKQFNAALNLGGNAKISKDVSIEFQVQTAVGKDDIHFKEDPKLLITDLIIDFQNVMGSSFNVLIGSFDTPFGDQVKYVSNNAETFRNPFLMNSLFYSAFGGEVGTLNTLGINIYRESKLWDMALSITNGTDEEAVNQDGNFEYLIGAWLNIGKIARIGGAFMKSDDRKNDIEATGLEADLTTAIADLRINLPSMGKDKSYIKGYYGYADWDDKTDNTEDALQFWMVEAKYSFYKKIYIAGRYSVWQPKDHNGDGTGMSLALPSPSTALAETVSQNHGGIAILTDQKVTRTQVALGYLDDAKLNVKLICFFDNYEHKSEGHNTDTLGFIFAVNAGL